jgi:hypothetical protein
MLKLRSNKGVFWIAILAFLFITLAPLISQASSSSNELEHYEVICSSSGIKLVNVNDSSGSDDINPIEHCSYCSLSSEQIIFNSVSTKGIKYKHLLAVTPNNYSPNFNYRYLLVSLHPNAPPKA